MEEVQEVGSSHPSVLLQLKTSRPRSLGSDPSTTGKAAAKAFVFPCTAALAYPSTSQLPSPRSGSTSVNGDTSHTVEFEPSPLPETADAVTMAVAAARDCIRGMDKKSIDGLFLASTTLPFAVQIHLNQRTGCSFKVVSHIVGIGSHQTNCGLKGSII